MNTLLQWRGKLVICSFLQKERHIPSRAPFFDHSKLQTVHRENGNLILSASLKHDKHRSRIVTGSSRLFDITSLGIPTISCLNSPSAFGCQDDQEGWTWCENNLMTSVSLQVGAYPAMAKRSWVICYPSARTHMDPHLKYVFLCLVIMI